MSPWCSNECGGGCRKSVLRGNGEIKIQGGRYQPERSLRKMERGWVGFCPGVRNGKRIGGERGLQASR